MPRQRGVQNREQYRPQTPACNEAAQPVPAIEEEPMNGIIYLVGLIVIIMFILSFLGLR